MRPPLFFQKKRKPLHENWTNKKIEYLIFKDTTKLGISGCREVKIGTHKTKSLLTGEQEFVDYMTITSDGEISCYEIKSSINDLKSTARLSFLGHKNFLVLPHTLYLQIANEWWFLEKLENHSIGIIVLDENNNLCLLKKCKKKKLSIGTQTLLLESFARSAARDAKKLYELENQEKEITSWKQLTSQSFLKLTILVNL